MTRADEFLQLCNGLSAHLCRVANLDPGTSFSRLVDAAAKRNATVKKYESRLKALGKLRNAIVHHEDYPPDVIAEPSAGAVAQFSSIADAIRSPVPVIPRFRREVRCFLPSDPLSEVLGYMHDRDYSQVAIRADGSLRLLTTEGVARWFAAHGAVADDLCHPAVADALRYDLSDGFMIFSATQSIDEARQAFATELDRGQARLYALLITESAAATEEPLGIITPWDLLQAGDV